VSVADLDAVAIRMLANFFLLLNKWDRVSTKLHDPAWKPEEHGRYSTTNARSEGIMTSNWYKRPMERGQRGIVPMSGFYEWLKVERERIGKGGKLLKPELVKIPHYLTVRDKEVFGVAGLWDAYKEKSVDIDKRIGKARTGAIVRTLVKRGEDPAIARALIKRGEKFNAAVYSEAESDPVFVQENDLTPRWIQSFTIITTEANEIMAPIHDRMPAILHQRDWSRWLDRKPTTQQPIDLLRPFDADEMQVSLCNPLVGNVANNGPEMLIGPTPSQPPALQNSA
jgi:putative SOS response-associated peptidase YedK